MPIEGLGGLQRYVEACQREKQLLWKNTTMAIFSAANFRIRLLFSRSRMCDVCQTLTSSKLASVVVSVVMFTGPRPGTGTGTKVGSPSLLLPLVNSSAEP